MYREFFMIVVDDDFFWEERKVYWIFLGLDSKRIFNLEYIISKDIFELVDNFWFLKCFNF